MSLEHLKESQRAAHARQVADAMARHHRAAPLVGQSFDLPSGRTYELRQRDRQIPSSTYFALIVPEASVGAGSQAYALGVGGHGRFDHNATREMYLEFLENDADPLLDQMQERLVELHNRIYESHATVTGVTPEQAAAAAPLLAELEALTDQHIAVAVKNGHMDRALARKPSAPAQPYTGGHDLAHGRRAGRQIDRSLHL